MSQISQHLWWTINYFISECSATWLISLGYMFSTLSFWTEMISCLWNILENYTGYSNRTRFRGWDGMSVIILPSFFFPFDKMCFWDNSDNEALVNIHFPLLPFLVPLILLGFQLSNSFLFHAFLQIFFNTLKEYLSFWLSFVDSLISTKSSNKRSIKFYHFSFNCGNKLYFIKLLCLSSLNVNINFLN